VFYIGFQLLENKRKQQSGSKRRHWLAPPEPILGDAKGKMRLVLSYLRASMTNSKSGKLCDLDLMRKGAFLCNLTGKGWAY